MPNELSRLLRYLTKEGPLEIRANRPLSNLFRLNKPITDIHGISYPTVEHAYVSAKTLDLPIKRHIASLIDNNEAYAGMPALRFGRTLTPHTSFATQRLPLMEILLRKKFADPEFADLLASTGTRDIYERNHPFWGRPGADHLGRLIKQIRGT